MTMGRLVDQTPVITGAEMLNGLGVGHVAVMESLRMGSRLRVEAGDLVAFFRPGTIVVRARHLIRERTSERRSCAS